MNASNILANGATSATINLNTTLDWYYPSAVSFVTDLYVPIIVPNVSKVGVDVNGGFAEFVTVPAANAWRIPPNVPIEVAAVMEPLGNAVHTAFAGPLSGCNIAVTGRGPDRARPGRSVLVGRRKICRRMMSIRFQRDRTPWRHRWTRSGTGAPWRARKPSSSGRTGSSS